MNRVLARAVIAGSIITGVVTSGPAQRDAYAQEPKGEAADSLAYALKRIEAVRQSLISMASAGMLQEDAFTMLTPEFKDTEGKAVMKELLEAVVVMNDQLRMHAGIDLGIEGQTIDEKLKAVNKYLDRDGEAPIDASVVKEAGAYSVECEFLDLLQEKLDGVLEGIGKAPRERDKTIDQANDAVGQVTADESVSVPADTEDSAEEKEVWVNPAFLKGFYNPKFRNTLIRPLRLSADHMHTEQITQDIGATVNQRAVPMLDSEASVGAGIMFHEEAGAYGYAVVGSSFSILRARGIASYRDSLSWSVTPKGYLDSYEAISAGGHLELHYVHMFSSDMEGAIGQVKRAGLERLKESGKDLWAVDMSIYARPTFTSATITVPYALEESGPAKGEVHESSVSVPVGIEWGFPQLLGRTSTIWAEGLGAEISDGPVFNAYAAFSLNYNQAWRTVAIPRLSDTLGAWSAGGELKAVELRPIPEVQVGLGGQAMHTWTVDTTMLSGYLEAGLGLGTQPMEHYFMALRGGYVGEVGGDEINRIPSSPFISLNFSNSFGAL